MFGDIPLSSLSDFDAPAVLCLVALLVISDKLVWYKRLREVEKQRDEWMAVALDALGVSKKLTVHAEVTNQALADAAHEVEAAP